MKVIMTLVVEHKGELRLGKKIEGLASVESLTPVGQGGRYAVIINSATLEDADRAILLLRKKLPAAMITKQTTQYFSG